MCKLIQDLPVELVGSKVLGYLSVRDIVMLERACSSKKSHQALLEQIPHCPPVCYKYKKKPVLEWLAKRQCKICFLGIGFPEDNHCLHVKNLEVDHVCLDIMSVLTMESLEYLQESTIVSKVRSVNIIIDQNRVVMDKLSVCARNVEHLRARNSYIFFDWLTIDILKMWKLTDIELNGAAITTSLVSLVVQTCSELTNLKLSSHSIDVSAVKAIVQYCPKLKTLRLASRDLQWSLLSIRMSKHLLHSQYP